MNITRWLLPASVAAIATSLIAALGASITLLGPWYQGLDQPAWAPPDLLFGPAWTLIFALCAVSAAAAWMAAPTRETASALVGLYAFNGFLNLLWSFLFFRLQRPDIAAVQVWVLWASIALLIHASRRYSAKAAWLLLPYLLWVSFAGGLNVAVALRNPTG